MNETLGQMLKTLSSHRIEAGILLLVILAFLLLMLAKRGKKRSHLQSQHPKSPSTPSVGKEEKPQAAGRASSEPMESEYDRSTELASEQEERGEVTQELPVFEKPFEEAPGISRESFEDFRGKRVLMVEDNPVNRKLILTLMKGSGIELDLAEDGIEALEKLRKPDTRYDLILMDVNMPRMNGLECTQKIRSDSLLSKMPVVALTASTTVDEVKAILESGMNGYLNKPLNLGKLYTAFRHFLRQDEAPESNPASSSITETAADAEVLNTRIGLEHTNDDEGLYRMLLEDFLEAYGDSARQFSTYASEKDYDALHRLVIDLEGLSGTLGATELYRLTLSANQALEQGKTTLLPDYARKYNEAFQRFKEAAERYLGS